MLARPLRERPSFLTARKVVIFDDEMNYQFAGSVRHEEFLIALPIPSPVSSCLFHALRGSGVGGFESCPSTVNPLMHAICRGEVRIRGVIGGVISSTTSVLLPFAVSWLRVGVCCQVHICGIF